jgi:hypothetical protein
MSRAWAIVGEAYKYPQIKFADIGRKCFAWALRQAWTEAREAAEKAVAARALTQRDHETMQATIEHVREAFARWERSEVKRTR